MDDVTLRSKFAVQCDRRWQLSKYKRWTSGMEVFDRGLVFTTILQSRDRCPQSDSCIGFGIFYSACSNTKPNITCGNIAQCSSNDNGRKLTPAFGYILVQ